MEVLCILKRHWWKVRVGVSGFLTFKNIWHDLNYKNANNFLGFKLPNRYAYWIPLYIRSCCWKNLSYQIKASNLHIGPKWMCQLEIGYTTLHFFQNQHTHYQIDLALFINNGGRTWKTKWIQHNIYIFISISIGISVSVDWLIAPPLQSVWVDTQYVGKLRNKNNKLGSFRKN